MRFIGRATEFSNKILLQAVEILTRFRPTQFRIYEFSTIPPVMTPLSNKILFDILRLTDVRLHFSGSSQSGVGREVTSPSEGAWRGGMSEGPAR